MTEKTIADRPTAATFRQQHDDAEKHRQRSIMQNQLAVEIANSFPAEIRKLMHGASIPAHEGSSETLAAECEKHSTEVSTLLKQLDESVKTLSRVLAAAAESSDGNYGEVWSAAESLKCDKTDLSQRAVGLWAAAEKLASRMVAELAPLPAKLEAEAESVVAKVKDELTKMGSGIESHPGFGINHSAAEHQFNYAARMNMRSRKAIAAAHDARASWSAAVEVQKRCKSGITTAREFLHKAALKSITG